MYDLTERSERGVADPTDQVTARSYVGACSYDGSSVEAGVETYSASVRSKDTLHRRDKL